MTIGLLAERFDALVPLTGSERASLDRIEGRERQLRRGGVLLRENDPNNHVFVIMDGMLMSSVVLDDGRRQILDFLFPGDMVGLCTLAYARAVESVSALSECRVCAFDRGSVAGILVHQPRLAGLFMTLGQIERVALTDRLAGLGRTSAVSRVAALLLQLRDRMSRQSDSPPQSFVLPVTQEEIGDAIGLTAVHVNRMLRRLEEDALITRNGAQVTISDERRLSRIANYTNRNVLDLGWLPAPRD